MNNSSPKFQNSLFYKSFIYYILYIFYISYNIFHFQIIIDGRDKKEEDIGGQRLPTLVYMAREKRPQWPHNFKAGALNALVIYQILYMSFWVKVMLCITFVNDTSSNNFLLNLIFYNFIVRLIFFHYIPYILAKYQDDQILITILFTKFLNSKFFEH